MRIVVSDSSCLIDLRKASLLDAFLALPYEILIPNTLFEDELLRFSDAQKRGLIRGGLKAVDMPGPAVLRAREVVHTTPRLSIHDGFAFALAEAYEGSILVTGDRQLRALATSHGIEAHGVFWIIDRIYENGTATAAVLVKALRSFAEDASVRLPRRELVAAIQRFERAD